MFFAKQLIVAILCASIALSPVLVEARAGGKSSRSGSSSHQSMGSAGSKTHDSRAGKPIERSMTPKASPAPTQAPRPANPIPPTPQPIAQPMAQPMGQPNFFQRHPILSGVMGGLAGSFIGNMLFNHSRGEAGTRNNDWDSADASPTGHALGSMLPFLFVIGLMALGYWLYRRKMAQQSFATNLSPANFDRPIPLRNDYNNWNSSPTATEAPTTTALRIDASDTLEFAETLVNIQQAWSAGDLVKLQRLVTPEMLAYFSEILADNASQGLRNCVQNVKVINQQLKDAWEESHMQYATAQLTWSAVDYTVKMDKNPGDQDYLVEGDLQIPVEASEVWTFARSRKGGDWILSAIQQL